MSIPPRIYLTGFMGSGKTTLGLLLAEAFEYQFVDLDSYIEDRAGEAIPDIFENSGEAGFRTLESKALLDSFTWTDTVIAAGGGAIITEETIEAVLQNGLLVYLSAEEDTIFSRIGATSHGRPLFGAGDIFRTLLRKRLPSYRRAHISYATDNDTPQESVAGLVDAIAKWSGTDKT